MFITRPEIVSFNLLRARVVCRIITRLRRFVSKIVEFSDKNVLCASHFFIEIDELVPMRSVVIITATMCIFTFTYTVM